jgi:hypothetical protein
VLPSGSYHVGILDAPAGPAFVSKKKCNSRQNFNSAASITLMSVSPEPPERLAEILLEILALSKPTRTSQSEPDSGSAPGELSDAHCVNQQSQTREQEHKDLQRP